MFSTWYGKYKYLTKRAELDKVLRDQSFKVASNPKYDGYERGLAWMVYNFFDKKSTGSGIKCQINNFQINFINQLLERLNDVKSILLLKTILGELIWN